MRLKLICIIIVIYTTNIMFAQNLSNKTGINFINKTISKELSSRSLSCPENTISGQVPVNIPGALTSNTSNGTTVAQSFSGLYQPIDGISVWAVRLINNGGNWEQCNTDPYHFVVKFYDDNMGEPGNVLETISTTVSAEPTGDTINDVPIFHYTIEFENAVNITEGWFSIENTDETCWFMILNTTVGEGVCKQYNGSWWRPQDFPVAYCLLFNVNPGAPNAATNLFATPAANGVLQASLNWNNPSLTFSGNTLTDLDSVVLYHDTVAVYTNTAPTIGGSESHIISLDHAGYYKFRVIGYNNFGGGSQIDTTIYVGEDVPAAPTNTIATLNGSSVNLTWNAPLVGLHGEYFSGNGLTYDVLRNGHLVGENITSTSFTENYTHAGVYIYTVIANNNVGEGGRDTSNMINYGFFYQENFSGAGLPNGWTANGNLASHWGISQSNIAGDEANELVFNWAPGETGSSFLTSPVFSTTGKSAVIIEFEHYDSHFGSGYELGLATSSNGTDWNKVWTVAPDSCIGPETFSIVIADGNVGSSNFQLTLTFEGNTFQTNGWYIDNVRVGVADVPPMNTITFHATNSVNHTNIEGAAIHVNGFLIMTNASGNATVSLPDGEYNYTASASGYLGTNGSTIVSGVPITVEIEMEPGNLVNTIKEPIFKIYPNPSKGIFNIQSNGTYEVKVKTINGEIIRKKMVENKDVIDLSDQTPGVYIIQVISDKLIQTKKLIIE